MKKICICSLFFVLCSLVTPLASRADVVIKKSEPVAPAKSGTASGGTSSLVPSLIGLVTGVVELNQQQNLLTKECEPTTSDISFVDNAIKEWAKTGQMTAKQMGLALKRKPCEGFGGGGFDTDTLYNRNTGQPICYNWFDDEGRIWYQYPRVGSVRVCKKEGSCASDRDKDLVTDLYDIFYLVDFGPADYNPTEATMAAKLLAKMETCSKAKLSAKKRALWGEFLANTASGLGQKTDTKNIMDQIGGIVQTSGKGLGVDAMSSIGGIATQMISK